MGIIYFCIHFIEYTFFIYFGFSAFYILVFAFGGRFFSAKKTDKSKNIKSRKFAVLIPGYKEDNVIYDVAVQSLKQDYPSTLFDIIIIADTFKKETIDLLNTLDIRVVEVSFEKSTKSKALNKAMEIIGDNYDVALVLDADNIMATDFISRINSAFDEGFIVVQGHRVAKNMNTSFAVLDAISEEVNNNIFRKGHRAFGFSSALIGSGMAFDYPFFKKIMAQIDAVGGFDKELELKLLRDGYKIEFLDHALVMDEKVQKAEVFANQRKRWLSAQFVYFSRFILAGLYHLIFKANIDFFDKVYQMITPPRILLIGFTGLLAFFYSTISLFFPENKVLALSPIYWNGIFIAVVLAFLLSIPSKFYNKQTLKALITLPKAFFLMFLSLFKLKGANNKFIHTEHGTSK